MILNQIKMVAQLRANYCRAGYTGWAVVLIALACSSASLGTPVGGKVSVIPTTRSPMGGEGTAYDSAAHRVVRQAEEGEATTASPEEAEEATTAAPAEETTSEAPTGDNSTTVSPPAGGSSVNITAIDYKNYTYVDHTSFNHTMNNWDFEGTWNKYDLSDIPDATIALPRPNATGEDPNTGAAPDQNNFVFINNVFSVAGVLSKRFPACTSGEVIINYYIVLDGAGFTVTMVNDFNARTQLYNSSADAAPVGQWTAVSVNFYNNQTASAEYYLQLEVIGLPDVSDESVETIAVHHIAVGARDDDFVILPTTTVAPYSNETFFPPGSLDEIEKISSDIWTALYVFLALFLICVVAVVVLVARGRCR